MIQQKKIFLSVIVTVLVIAVSAVVYYFIPPVKYWAQKPINFEECKEAKGRIWHTNRVWCEFRGQTFEEKALKIGAVENIDIQSPHPYPNGASVRSLVWKQTISHPGATSLRLHFNKFEIKGISNIPTIFEEVDHGKCDLNAPEGYKRELIDPNTIRETQIVTQQPGEVSVGSARLIRCGIVREKKQFSSQEIFDKGYVKGDFMAVKNKNGKVLDILMRESLPTFNGSPAEFLREDVWGQTYADVDTIIIELYTDESDNGFGLYIDKYARGFTEEERERVNQETTNQYLQDCERQGIPLEQCSIPK